MLGYYVNEYQSAAIDGHRPSPRSQRNSVLSRHPRYVRSTTKFFSPLPMDDSSAESRVAGLTSVCEAAQ